LAHLQYHYRSVSNQTTNGPEDLDPAATARLSVRNTVLAQLEAALLADKLSVSEPQAKRKGSDPYNQATCRPDAWALRR
jgi:hypothetical protein